jgi:hypothetical protein
MRTAPATRGNVSQQRAGSTVRTVCRYSTPRAPAIALSNIAAASEAWVQHALNHPLLDADTNTRCFIVGTASWAPLQWEVLDAVLQQVTPAAIAIEAAPDATPGLMLPHPAWIEALLGHYDGNIPLHALDPSVPSSGSPAASAVGAAAPRSSTLEDALPGTAATAAIGRDCMDSWELIGFYGASDFARRPQQVSQTLKRFGYLPGAEYAAAVQVRGTLPSPSCMCAPACSCHAAPTSARYARNIPHPPWPAVCAGGTTAGHTPSVH